MARDVLSRVTNTTDKVWPSSSLRSCSARCANSCRRTARRRMPASYPNSSAQHIPSLPLSFSPAQHTPSLPLSFLPAATSDFSHQECGCFLLFAWLSWCSHCSSPRLSSDLLRTAGWLVKGRARDRDRDSGAALPSEAWTKLARVLELDRNLSGESWRSREVGVCRNASLGRSTPKASRAPPGFEYRDQRRHGCTTNSSGVGSHFHV